MPKNYRNTLRKLALATSVEEKIALFNQLANDLDERFNKMNNLSAAIIGQVENTLNTLVDQLRVEINDLKVFNKGTNTLLEARLKAYELQDQRVENKIHDISNFLTVLEGKLNDLVELAELNNERFNSQ